MHIKNFIKIDNASSVEEDDGIIRFKEPLKITDNSTQWNNTSYDIDSLRIDEYDGIVTQDHGNKIEDVIGKVINLKKGKDFVSIDAIKFAVKENPIAVLAKNLLKSGFVTGFSIETIGQEPDNENVWRNHSLCGLSIVAHPNNKHAYATVMNSIKECNNKGLDSNKIINFLSLEDDVVEEKSDNKLEVKVENKPEEKTLENKEDFLEFFVKYNGKDEAGKKIESAFIEKIQKFKNGSLSDNDRKELEEVVSIKSKNEYIERIKLASKYILGN